MTRWILRSLPLGGLIIVLGIVVYALFTDMFACPSCYLFVDGADGLKNYFTPAWFVKMDSGIWFHGMNYPYGEHIVYTDNQPIWSLAMKAVDHIFPMGAHVTGTINMLVILSLVICGVLLYFVMRELGLPRWYAAVVSLPLTLLSPQIVRFTGHYSLAHTYYLPLFLLLFLRWARSPTVLRGSLLLAAIVWMGFTHLYFLLISAAFLVCYAFVVLCFNRFRPSTHSLGSLAIAALAGACVFLTVRFTDPVEDRPEDVYGLYIYSAKAEGTFLPWYEPLAQVWTQDLNIKRPEVEGITYVGMPVTLLMIPLLIWVILRIRRRRSRRRVWTNDPATIFLAALLVWLYASSWLLSIGGEQLIEMFPLLGQFRSLGRLAWIFYYVAGISVAYWGYLQLRAHSGRRRYVIAAGLAVLFAIWSLEARQHLRMHIQPSYPKNTIFKYGQPFADLLEQRSETDKYQAILSLPLVAVGSERINVDRGMWSLRMAMQCAWETGLPILDSNMSRSSVSQALSLLQMLSDPYLGKDRLADMDGRPLLLLATQSQSLTPAEKRLVDRARHIGRAEYIDVYSLPISAFYRVESSSEPEIIVHQGFEDNPARHSLAGTGAYFAETAFSPLYTMRDTFSTDTMLRYSSWSYIGPDGTFFPVLRHQVRAVTGELVHDEDYSMFSSNPHNVRGSWVETAFDFAVRGDSSEHVFLQQTRDAWVDEMRITRLE